MTALVTGGGGFLGAAIVRRLVARGVRTRSFSRGSYPALHRLGVEVMTGDLADAGAVAAAVEGAEVVFHVAARVGVGGRFRDYHRTNVIGTANVLAACRSHGVQRLVYTSTPSVIFDGRDLEGADESVPYPRRYLAPYPRTKALAERAVLAANGPGLATLALRPPLIWGPGDPHLVPRLVALARAGKLRRIGRTPKRVDATYIDNAADAHLLAADRLAAGSRVAGRAFFVSNGEPLEMWTLVNRILAAAGVEPVNRTLTPQATLAAGWILEWIHRLLRLRRESPMTRFLARQLATAHWFDISAARRDLGYEPAVSTAEGLRRLRAHLRGASGPDAPFSA